MRDQSARSDQVEPNARIVMVGSQHRLARTVDGRLAYVPRSARAGDEVWILASGKVPFVLRPKEEESSRFQFIGECYVYGMMQGEAGDDTAGKDPLAIEMD